MTAAGRARSFILPLVRTARLLVPAVLLAVTSPAPSATPPAVPAAAAPAQEEVASVRREVRLRKLHLVRPDLIQYPLSYDVYC